MVAVFSTPLGHDQKFAAVSNGAAVALVEPAQQRTFWPEVGPTAETVSPPSTGFDNTMEVGASPTCR